MPELKKIEKRTVNFIEALEKLKAKGIELSGKELADILGIKNVSSISEIKAKRQNIQPDSWERFKKAYKISESSNDSENSVNRNATKLLLNKDAPPNDYKEKYIQVLEENNRLQKQFDELKNHIDNIANKMFDQLHSNLKTLEKHQLQIMGQIRAASILAIERSAGKDQNKFRKELERLGKLAAELSLYDEQKDNLTSIDRMDKVST